MGCDLGFYFACAEPLSTIYLLARAIHYLLFTICCSLFAVPYLLFAICCSLLLLIFISVEFYYSTCGGLTKLFDLDPALLETLSVLTLRCWGRKA